jgi:polyisoprenoid-binding protein YceI
MRLGPENGSLTVRTGRTGAAAKAGHNLLIEVTAWEATLEESSLVLAVDPASLRVLEGTGGMQALGDDDKASIAQTIDEEVLKGQAIEFRSTAVQTEDGRLRVRGDLTLGGTTGPIELELATGGGRLTGGAVVKQSDWGIAPYSTLFGTLKVVDEVEVAIDATLPDQSV